MPYPDQSLMDVRQEAPPHDYLLVADDTKDVPNVVSDALHAAHHTNSDIALYYRGVLILVGENDEYGNIIHTLSAKLSDPPDYDPNAASFPDDPTV